MKFLRTYLFFHFFHNMKSQVNIGAVAWLEVNYLHINLSILDLYGHASFIHL